MNKDKICYICGEVLMEGTSHCSHYEHIIPNALGGRLTCNSILCKKCGNDYSKYDNLFVKIFDGFIHHLEEKIKIDRNHRGVQMCGWSIDNEIVTKGTPLKIDKNGVYPREPIEMEDEDGKVTIIANDKVAKNIKNKKKYENKEVDIVNNLGGIHALQFSKNIKEFNEVFKFGFIKIAVEFALQCGLKREELNIAITVNENGKGNVNFQKTPLFPFIPLDLYSQIFEKHRDEIERYYPSHTLILFSEGKKIFCYVDLFSTFQYYVLLADDYTGENVNKVYYQPLFKPKELYTYTREELEEMRNSDLHIVISERGIDVNGKNIPAIIDEILLGQTKKTEPRFYDNLSKLLCDIGVIESYLLEDREDDEIATTEYEILKNNSNTDTFRKQIMDSTGVYSYPFICYVMFTNAIREYTHMKFHQLEKFSNEINIQRQIDNIVNEQSKM